MVDFKKKLSAPRGQRPLDPLEIYESLDRASDKGPLRPAQLEVLSEWHRERRAGKDVILKLHTGQGKTLIGLLILQSKLNERLGPALYICPNKLLVAQTCEQAAKFGVAVTTIDGELPESFVNSKSILVATVHSLFNGHTRFGLDANSQEVGAIVVDDAHACMDAISAQLSLQIPKDVGAYGELLSLFGSALRDQGAGTYADLLRHEYDAILPVPYWEWIDKVTDVASILSRYSDNKAIRFAWPILRDVLDGCSCVVSGAAIEISPHLLPLHRFGSFAKASHRVYMSATITDDSFLLKGLRIPQSAITNPLRYAEERWSGEKMILIPSLIDEDLDRGRVVERFSKPRTDAKFGVVALCPSFKRTKDWGAYGADVADVNDIAAKVSAHRAGAMDKTLVLVNRYDGVDLPDSACRILIVDSRPYSESIRHRYLERCIGNSDEIAARTARSIEQGLGRSVRGEKDYCAIILVGPDLIRQIRTVSSRRFFSAQTRTQIEIGMEIADDARAEGTDSATALIALINQCLKRDPGWKAFYAERMNALKDDGPRHDRLTILALELLAEQRADEQRYDEAVAVIQEICDKHVTDDSERAWYLQEMARLVYRSRKVKADEYQLAAHRKNRHLLKPREGMIVQKIAPLAQKRVDSIVDTLRALSLYEELALAVADVTSKLTFGVEAETFEKSLDRLGKLLGFACERPDAEWGEGPDNLWCLRDGEYLLIESKSEVLATRGDINKYESEQLNASAAWFSKTYAGCKARVLLVHPAKRLHAAAAFLQPTEVVRSHHLELLVKNVRKFFGEFKNVDFQDIAPKSVQNFLEVHGLGVADLWTKYAEPVRF